MSLPELNPIDVSVSLTPIDVSELTTGNVEGTGVFDTLMRSAKAHLKEEYDSNRISGAEYTTVYLGALTAVMQQSVAYILNHQQKEKVSAEIGLIRQQTVTELTQTDDTIPEGLGFNDSTAIEGLVKSRKDLEDQQILSAMAQVEISNEEIELAKTKTKLSGQQLITELAQTDDTISPEAMLYAFNGTSDIEGLIATQKEKVAAEVAHTAAEISLTNQRTVTELAQTDNSAGAEGIVKSQKDKIDADIALTTQQTVTELAQTNNVAASEGLISSQKSKLDADKLHTEAEIALVNQRKETELAQTDDIASGGGLTGAQRNKIEAEITRINSENDWTVQKIVTELAQTDEATSASGLIGSQKAKIEADTAFIAKQEDKIDSEILLTNQKTTTELAQTDDAASANGLVGSIRDKNNAEISLINQKKVTEQAQTEETASASGLSGAQKAKIASETLLLDQKTKTELAQTDDTASAEGLVGAQKNKTEAEHLLLKVKSTTEMAQTTDTVPALHTNGVLLAPGVAGTPYSVTGVIGKQNALFDAQTQGFFRDAEQKLAKMMLDVLSVRMTVDSGTVPPTALDNPSLQVVLEKAKAGINV